MFGGKGVVILARWLEPAVDVRDGQIGDLDLLAPSDDKVGGGAARAGAGWTAPTSERVNDIDTAGFGI